VARVREVLAAEPALARVVAQGHTPLMWLPPHDEDAALELVELLLAHGADPALRNPQGQTAADRAERLGMFRVAEALR
jgi:ankyrin repeat protein